MGHDKLLAIELMRQRIRMERAAYDKLDESKTKQINELREELKSLKENGKDTYKKA